MTLIKDVSPTYSLPEQRLFDRGVVTVEELWACISHDVDTGIDKVVDRTSAPPQDGQPPEAVANARREYHAALLAFLIADALTESTLSRKPKPFGLWFGVKPLWDAFKEMAKDFKRSWQNRRATWSKLKSREFWADIFWGRPKAWQRRVQASWSNRSRLWPDLVFFGLPLVIIGLGLRAQFLQQKVVQRVAVKQGVTVPSFTVLDPQQLIAVHTLDQPGTFATIDELKPRYAATNLVSGTLVKDEQLLPAGPSKELAGLQLLTLPIKNDVGRVAKPMDRVQLMLASHDKEKPGEVIRDVILLSATKTGEATSVVVAVTDAAANRMTPLLGLSDVFVLQNLPSASTSNPSQ